MSLSGIEDFALERYFARWEFEVRHQLSASDVEPFPMSELLALADADARRRWDQLTLGYTESTGLPALREAIASQYEQCDKEDIVVMAGAEEGIFLLMHALVSTGDDVVVVTPAYQSLHALPRSLGANVREVRLRHERGWQLDPDEVADVVGPNTRLIIINFPHNPTGAHIPADVQQRLVEIADRANAVLLSDEVYRGLEADPAERLRPGADIHPRVVSLGVMSKSFALPGLRIGWLATRDGSIRERIVRLKDYTTICSSAPSEILALIALRAADAVLRRSRAIVEANRTLARGFFAANRKKLEWVPPRAGSTAFPRFVDRGAEEVAKLLVTSASTLLVPGRIFGADDTHFRLGLGRRDFPEALAALGRELDA